MVASCSQQNIENKDVIKESVVVDTSNSVSKDTVVVNPSIENNIKSDTVNRVPDGDREICITDTFQLKDRDTTDWNWMKTDRIARSLNDWKYSENAEYIVIRVEWEDDSGCRGDSMNVYRNGIDRDVDSGKCVKTIFLRFFYDFKDDFIILNLKFTWHLYTCCPNTLFY